MTPLPDGYTFKTNVHGKDVWFRPLLQHERRFWLPRLIWNRERVAYALTSRVWPSWGREHVLHNSELFRMVAGLDRDEDEVSEGQNLADGVLLELLHPHVARRDCSHCQEWWYDHDKNEVVQKSGRPLKRPEGTPVPCETPEGCPKGSPSENRSLSLRNRLAYEHYLQCKAVRHFPPDPIVRRNARIISMVEDHVAEQRRVRLERMVEWITRNGTGAPRRA